MESKYYKLTFFACPSPGEYPQEDLQAFVCQQDYYSKVTSNREEG